MVWGVHRKIGSDGGSPSLDGRRCAPVGFTVTVMYRLRGHRLDAFLIVLAVAQAVALAVSGNAGRYVAAGLAAAAALVLLLRNRGPLVVSVAAFGLLAASLAAEPKSPNVQFFGLMATFAVVAAVNTTRNGVIAWFAGVLLIGAATGTTDSGSALADFLLTLAFCTFTQYVPLGRLGPLKVPVSVQTLKPKPLVVQVPWLKLTVWSK